jgi:hypothetical protein
MINATSNEADVASFCSFLSSPHNLNLIKVKAGISGNQGLQGKFCCTMA